MSRFTVMGATFLALVLAFTLSVANAQVNSGSISGTVTDASGAVLPGADVTAKNVATNQVVTTTTDSAGLFRLSLLAVGNYTVTVSKAGFEKLVVANVEVAAGVDHGLKTLTMKIGQVTATVEVSAAAAAMVETTQAQISSTLSGTMLQDFPSIQGNEGMDFLALTIPGVVHAEGLGFSNSNGVDFGVNGIRPRNNDQQIDGQNNNDNSVAGPYLFLSNPDFVQEYQITTNNFAPEYGRNAGSVVNIITKSGTNSWHGTVAGSESNAALDTLTNNQKYFEHLTRVPWFNDEFASGAVGGPIWKDHVFYFGGFDEELIPGTSVDPSSTLTPDPTGLGQMQACFPTSNSVSALVHYGPYGVTGGSPTPIPGTTTVVPVTEANGTICDVEYAEVERTLSTPFHEYDFIQRVDANIGQHDRIFGRYIYNHDFSGNVDEGQAAAGYPVNVPSLSQQAGGGWTHIFSTRMTNEFRFTYGRLNVEFGGNGIGNTVPNQSAIGTALAVVEPGSSSLYLPFGPADNLPQGRIVNTYQAQDNWSYILGKHQLKAGVNYTHQRSPNIFLPYYNGGFNFGSPSAFAQDIPSTINITSGSPVIPFVENDTFVYFGDDWRFKPNLTINLGLTYSYYGQPANLFHDRTVAQQASSMPFWETSLPQSVTTFPSIPAPKTSFGPNLGFAWSPTWSNWLTGNGKQTVLRGGFRMAYDPPYYNIYLNIASSAPNVLSQTLTGAGASGNPLLAAPFGPAVRTELASSLVLGVYDPRSFSQTSVTPDFGPDRVFSWSLGVQREFSNRAALEIRYVGNHGDNLFQSIDGNPYILGLENSFPNFVPAGETPCTAANAVVPTAIGRANCDEGSIRIRTNTGYSNYDALQIELRTNHLWNQLTMRTGYTWSHTLDNVSEIFGSEVNLGVGTGQTLAFSQNPSNYTSAEYGNSGLDFPNVWTTSFVEELPFFRTQHGFTGHVLGGWGVSGTYLLSTGQPWTPVQFIINCLSQPVPCYDSYRTPTDTFPFDYAFISHFQGTYETARPYLSNPNAPVTSVGMYAGDACNYAGVGCALAPNTLLNFDPINLGTANPVTPATVTKSQVRYIVNGPEAASVFGTPFGTVGRNTLFASKANTVNLGIFKEIKFKEHATLRFSMNMLNAFNHPNFNNIDPFLDDAGYYLEGTGFGVPQVQSGGNRLIKFALKIIF